MSNFMLPCVGRRTVIAALALLTGCAIAAEAQAIHPRRRVVVYDAACAGPIGVGPSSFNPAGFGFGGYSYGGYPYYGYWGNLPGPYAGFSGYGPAAGPAYGLTGYSAYPMAVAPPGAPGFGMGGCNVGCAVAPAPCDPCLMTPCAYRRYLRRMCRAMARCGYGCGPAAACSAYGAALGIDTLDDDGAPEGQMIEFTPNNAGAESVAPPAEERPSPSLDRTF